MADYKPSGFRFRLPWLLKHAPTPSPAVAPEPPTQQPPTTVQTTEPSSQPPRTTLQTFVASTSAQRPPFRPPGKAPTTPASPRWSPPQSVTSPPTPTVSPKSSPPKSPITKTIDPIATQPKKETETIPTTETTGPLTLPQRSPLVPPKQAQSPPSPPQTLSPTKPDSKPSSPSSIRTLPQPISQPLSPSRMAAQPHETTPPKPSQTRSPPRSPPQSAYQPTSPLPSPPTKTTTEVAEIKRPNEITEEKYSIESNNLVPQGDNDLAFNAKSRDVTKAKGIQIKSQKPKPTITSRVPLQREIKDNIFKFIHKISTSSPNEHIDEKHTSAITLAGDNTGASMHLTSDHAIKRDSKVDENQETKVVVNNNVQGINNSMMFDSSVSERNPGVHLRLSRDIANTDDSNVKDTDTMEMQKAEVNITPQNLVYNPAFGIDDNETPVNGCEVEVEVL